MKLERLTISLCQYGANEGKYTGEVRFENQSSGVDITLSPEVSKRVLSICSEELVEQARRTANLIAGEVLEHKKQEALSGPTD
jgi:hypothetical protein